MPYLICDKCNVSYEIENRSEMDGFHTCNCGNELKYYQTIEEYMNEGSMDSDVINNDTNDLSGNKKGVFYSVNKKNLVTLQMEMLREDKEREEKERLRRDLNYKIKHAIAENNEKRLKNNYEPLIIKEFGDKSFKKKKEILLQETESLKEVEEENVNVMGDLKKQLNSDGLSITIFGFIGIISIIYSFYLFAVAISTVFFGLMIIMVSMEKYYNKSRLRWIYALNGMNLAFFCITLVIFIILALMHGNYSLLTNSTFISYYLPAMIFIYGGSSYFMFCRAAIPDYPEIEENLPLDNEMHHIDKTNPLYGKRKVE